MSSKECEAGRGCGQYSGKICKYIPPNCLRKQQEVQPEPVVTPDYKKPNCCLSVPRKPLCKSCYMCCRGVCRGPNPCKMWDMPECLPCPEKETIDELKCCTPFSALCLRKRYDICSCELEPWETPGCPNDEVFLEQTFEGYESPHTSQPKSLTYACMQMPGLMQVPTLVIMLCDRMEKYPPPLDNMVNGMCQELVLQCDTMLDNLLFNRDLESCFNKIVIETVSLCHIVVILQLLLLRLNVPTFIATKTLCDILWKEGFCCTPWIGITFPKGSNRQNVELHGSMQHSSAPQNATFAYLIQRFQKLCQREIVCRMKKGDCCSMNNRIFCQAVLFLSRLFGPVMVGLMPCFTAKKGIQTKPMNIMNVKIMILRYCLGIVPNRYWHEVSFFGLIDPPMPGTQTAHIPGCCCCGLARCLKCPYDRREIPRVI